LLREKYGKRFGSALGLELGRRGVSINEGSLGGDVDGLEVIQTPVQASGDEPKFGDRNVPKVAQVIG
jgi:hypothetical protein